MGPRTSLVFIDGVGVCRTWCMGPRTSCVYRRCGCLQAVVNGAKDFLSL